MSIFDKDSWTMDDLREYQRMHGGKDPSEGVRERMRGAGVPERYLDVPTGELPSGSLYVFGAVGTGKTFYAASVARAWLTEHWDGCLFRSSVGIMAELRQGARLEEYDVPFLVIDDMGKEAPSPWVLSQLWEIVDRRYGGRLKTVVTSNYSFGELARSMGGSETAKAIVSRFCEDCEVIKLEGSDRRYA